MDHLIGAGQQLLSGIQCPPLSLRAREQFLRSRVTASGLVYLSRGFVGQYRCDRLGRRQFLGLQLPGDFLNLSGGFMDLQDAEAEALGPVEMQVLSLGNLQALEAEVPAVVGKLWRISMIEGAISRYWIFRIGRLAGRARVASFFCEMLLRLYARRLCTLEEFDLPLTQTDLSEVTGMTAVHVNRMLSELREEGICTFMQGAVQIQNLPELFRRGQYCWDYLYLDADLDRELREKVLSPHRSILPGPKMQKA